MITETEVCDLDSTGNLSSLRDRDTERTLLSLLCFCAVPAKKEKKKEESALF